jgi:hypothetical protein
VNPPYHPPYPVIAPQHHVHPATPQAPPAPGSVRTESEVQWIVGWVRDLLVIAMSVANLVHVGGGH